MDLSSFVLGESSLFDSSPQKRPWQEEDGQDLGLKLPVSGQFDFSEVESLKESTISSGSSTNPPSPISNPSSEFLEPHTLKATLSDGRTVHIRKKRKVDRSEEFIESYATGTFKNYGISITELLSEIKLKEIEKQERDSNPETNKQERGPESLLCEKWRPNKWIDLIGPEKTHRHMLKWLSSWSKVVFNEDGSGGKNSDQLDPLGRPQKRIMLIHGPPGVGKTTAAHIVANQAGYDVLEINASDERSGQAVKDKILFAVGSHRMNSKPVCIIADEIEGAAENGFIRVLMDLIVSDQRATNLLSQGRKSKKNKSKLLLRPLIAICNDVYANSLRQLRPLAELIPYNRVSSTTLVNRLRHVCYSEGLSYDIQRLNEIAQIAECDLRSCLNVLQFGQSSKQSSSSAKDTNKSWIKVTNRIFRRRKELHKDDESQQIIAEVNSGSDYDKVMMGCFSLYPSKQYHDDQMHKPALIGEWLNFYDHLNHQVYSHQQAVLMEYFAYPIAAFYSLFHSSNNVRNEVPKSEFEIHEKLKQNKEICSQIWSKASPQIQQLFQPSQIALELAPYSLSILNPSLEAKSLVGNKAAQEKLSHAVVTMISLDMSIEHDKNNRDSLMYQLNPSLETLCVVNEEEALKFTTSKNSIRQLLATEYRRQKMAGSKQKLQPATNKIDQSTTKHELVKTQIITKDFFGRSVQQDDSKQQCFTQTPAEKRVWIQYNEGYSNAVRKNLSWHDFWTI